MTKKTAQKSPSNYRSFTERSKKFFKDRSTIIQKIKFQAVVFLYIATLALIIFMTLDLLKNLQRQKEINFQRGKIESQVKVWQDIADRFQGYKEAYYQLASLEYQLGNIDKAKFYINKALYLDPNFEKARELLKILNNY